jgi:hypothetical protein
MSSLSLKPKQQLKRPSAKTVADLNWFIFDFIVVCILHWSNNITNVEIS